MWDLEWQVCHVAGATSAGRPTRTLIGESERERSGRRPVAVGVGGPGSVGSGGDDTPGGPRVAHRRVRARRGKVQRLVEEHQEPRDQLVGLRGRQQASGGGSPKFGGQQRVEARRPLFPGLRLVGHPQISTTICRGHRAPSDRRPPVRSGRCTDACDRRWRRPDTGRNATREIKEARHREHGRPSRCDAAGHPRGPDTRLVRRLGVELAVMAAVFGLAPALASSVPA